MLSAVYRLVNKKEYRLEEKYQFEEGACSVPNSSIWKGK